jgi:hypothetical protein
MNTQIPLASDQPGPSPAPSEKQAPVPIAGEPVRQYQTCPVELLQAGLHSGAVVRLYPVDDEEGPVNGS